MSAPRFYSTSPTQTHEKKSVYIFPFQNIDGKTQVLVGQKKVLCYPAIESLELKQPKWNELSKSIQEQRWNKCLESRFKGLFFYAGGKPTCFGGGVKPNENEMTAAARELLEETGVLALANKKGLTDALIHEITGNLFQVYDSHRFKGVYFGLDIDKCILLKEFLTPENIMEENKRIQKDEIASGTLTVKTRREQKLSESISEMHSIEWVELSKLAEHLGQNAHVGALSQYIQNEVQRGVNLLFQILFNVNDTRNETYKKCKNFMTQKIPGEIVIDNVDAAKELITKLTPSKQESNESANQESSFERKIT